MSSSSKSGLSPLAAAAGKVPPGLSLHDRNSSYNGTPMTAVLGVLVGIALVFYCIRIYAKAALIRRCGWDDLVCTFGMIGTLLNIVCFGIASIDGPLGKHIWNTTLGEFIGPSFAVTAYIMQVSAPATFGFIKLSIFLFYLNIFWPLKWCRWTIYISASISSAFYLSIMIVQLYFMTPRPGETLAKHFAGNLASRVTHLSIPTSSVGLVIDIILLVIPLRAVFQLNMATKKKVRLMLIFFVGIIAIIGSILSLSFKIKTYGNTDLTYHLILVNLFIAIEMVFGICIASMPLVARTMEQHRPQLYLLAESFSSPFLHIGRRWTSRTSSDHESSAVYEVKRSSESNNQLMELGMAVEVEPKREASGLEYK